ncbi:MAG: hypothetical protein NC082_08325 [Clostridiales bacterium]|nr:hypothetical protein [Clostridiales bacterium]
MKTTVVSISPDVVRARVQATSALHIFLNNLDRQPITADQSGAINQCMVFAFSRALIRLGRWVDGYRIDPENFYEHTDDLLLLEVTFKVRDDVEMNWPVVRRALEEYVSDFIMVETLGSANSMYREYLSMCNQSLDDLVALFEMPEAGSPLRLSRCY